jgi:hypothetical protein
VDYNEENCLQKDWNMASVRVLIGVLLLLLSLSIMGLFVILPAVSPTLDDVPFVKSILQGVLCKPGETLTSDYSTFNTPTSTTRSAKFYCTDRERQERDVTGQAILYGIIGYLATFLPALLLMITGAQSAKRARMQDTMAQMNAMMSGQGGSFDSIGFHIDVDPAGNVVVRMPDGKIYTGQKGVSTPADLPERLGQLQTAFDSGLITRTEYDTKRAEILSEI